MEANTNKEVKMTLEEQKALIEASRVRLTRRMFKLSDFSTNPLYRAVKDLNEIIDSNEFNYNLVYDMVALQSRYISRLEFENDLTAGESIEPNEPETLDGLCKQLGRNVDGSFTKDSDID